MCGIVCICSIAHTHLHTEFHTHTHTHRHRYVRWPVGRQRVEDVVWKFNLINIAYMHANGSLSDTHSGIATHAHTHSRTYVCNNHAVCARTRAHSPAPPPEPGVCAPSVQCEHMRFEICHERMESERDRMEWFEMAIKYLPGRIVTLLTT